MKHFFRHSDFIKNNIKMKLETLDKNGIIHLEVKTRLSDTNGIRDATKSEMLLIDRAETMALEILGYSDHQELFLKNEYSKFYELVISLLENENLLLDYYYPIYKIIYVSKRKGRLPTETTINNKKVEFKKEYIKKIHELIESDSSKKTIEYLKNKSRGYISSIDIAKYEHAICDFLLWDKNLI